MELNGQEISALTAAQMGYSITRVSEGENTFAYMIRVPFDDQLVVKQVRFVFQVKTFCNALSKQLLFLHAFMC